MTSEEAALAACVMFSGLWAGLTAMLTHQTFALEDEGTATG